MINANFFIGQPVDYKKICKVYPPTISEIVNEKNYPVYKKLLMSSQEEIEDDYVEAKLPLDNMPTPLEYIFMMAYEDAQIKDIAQAGFEFFIKEPVTLLSDQKMVVIGDLKDILPKIKSISDLRILNNDNFFEFQNLLRQSVGDKEVEPYNPNENPKIKYFKAKARYRDKVKAKSKNALTLGATLASICCMNFGLNPLNIGELSQASVPVLIRYYQEKTKYDIDISSLLAGADAKKVKPQNWIRNIEDL